MQEKISIFWFRRDLRLSDNAGLYHALKSGKKVLPIFIFDTEILSKLANKSDLRVQFIHHQLEDMKLKLNKLNADLFVLHGKPEEIWKNLIEKYPIQSVFTNHDYEPYAQIRDEKVATFLASKNIDFQTFKDQVIFEKNEILTQQNKPYTIFTPYSKAWKAKLNAFYLKSYPTEKYFHQFLSDIKFDFPLLKDIGFQTVDFEFPSQNLDLNIVKVYAQQRDFPAIAGTTKLSVHLRFGTVSIRQLAKLALETSETWLNELIWRDFYMNILYHFPKVVSQSFKSQYDRIEWRNNETEFEAWCNGKTGYPIVDAGMRELNATGFMHNRVRMIVASFLTKHLLIDWRWGEAYFAEKLLDFDLAANNGGWQWAAGSGCDAAPYFRVFNPTLQTQKFDNQFQYIKKWVPELNDFSYPQPIVNHEFARKRCLEVYKRGLLVES